MASIKQATVALYHHDCYCSLSTEKFPEVELKVLSPVIYSDRKRTNTRDYNAIFGIKAKTENELEGYIKYLKNFKSVRKITILSRKPCEAITLQEVQGPNLSYDTVLKSNAVYSSLPSVQNGFEIHSVLANDPEHIKKMLLEFEGIGEAKILRIGDYQPKLSNIFSLTEKQKAALRLALAHGYYEWPKKSTLEELAAIEKTSRRSFQERLRRAERKILPKTIERILEE